MNPDGVEKVTLASCILHNLMRDRHRRNFNRLVDWEDEENNVVPGEWRDEDVMVPLEPLPNPRATVAPKNIRDYLSQYYNTRGAVPWQERILNP